MKEFIDGDNYQYPQGKAKGGKARAEKMTPDERKESALKAAQAKKEKAALPTVINEGKLRIADTDLDVAVLDNGTRVVTVTSVFEALGRTQRGYKKSSENQRFVGEIQMPPFMDAMNLIPFVSQDLKDQIPRIKYKTESGVVKEGHNVLILPLVGDLYLRARENNAIKSKEQSSVAQKAEILVRSLAKVGVIALVDEATGYQRDRERDALAKILEAFVAKEIQPYITTFPPEYYEELFRLRGLEYPPSNPKFRPQYFGLLTNDIVYKRLAPNILEELKKKTKTASKGTKLFQSLTPNIGQQKLREHLSSAVTVMKLSNDYPDFISKMNRIHPRFDDIIPQDLEDSDK
ncbi:hypothetical protein CIG19_16785 [Enterobacterales bacterium CwR94]|nr:hypothetical protein CIG19_16785 [Enterobacterales bacterium CwR94]